MERDSPCHAYAVGDQETGQKEAMAPGILPSFGFVQTVRHAATRQSTAQPEGRVYCDPLKQDGTSRLVPIRRANKQAMLVYWLYVLEPSWFS